MIVVDASVLAPSLIDSDPDGTNLRNQLLGYELVAPQLLDLEITSVFRQRCRNGKLTDSEADKAFQNLSKLAIERLPHRLVLHRIWELRHNLTPYDASYVALAEELNAVLWTRDKRMANAPGIRCETFIPPLA